MFPAGPAGAALLLLRLSVAASVLGAGILCWSLTSSVWMIIPAAVLAAELCLGFMTPYGASLCCLVELRAFLLAGREHRMVLALSILNGIVLALIGPGAYSVDSHLFGRQL